MMIMKEDRLALRLDVTQKVLLAFWKLFWYFTGLDVYASIAVRGATGDALIFRQELRHKGDIVLNGEKYVLQFDLGYLVENQH